MKKRKDNLISIKKALESKLGSKKIIKPSQTKVIIKEYKAPVILDDANRFFNKEMEEVKKAMFFQ